MKRILWCAALALGVVVLAFATDQGTLQVLSVLGAVGMLGMATSISEIRQDTTPANRLVRGVSNRLSKFRSSEFALDTVFRRLSARNDTSAKAILHEWQEDDEIPYADTVDGATVAGAAAGSVAVTVDNGARWLADDLIYCPDNATTPGKTLWIASKSTNVLTVYAVDGVSDTAFGTVPAFADAEKFKRMGNAKEEKSNASDSRATMPADFSNQCETQDAVLGISAIRLLSDNYTREHDWERSEDNTLWDFRRKTEANAVFGNRGAIADPSTGKTRHFQDGLVRYFSTNDLNYTTGSLTEAQMIGFMRTVFSGNNGSNTRLLFSCPALTEDLHKVLASTTTLRGTRDETVMGIVATGIKYAQYKLMIIDWQNGENLGKTNYGLIIDPANAGYRPYRTMQRKNVSDADVDGRDVQWIETQCVEVTKEKTHAVMRDTATDSFG